MRTTSVGLAAVALIAASAAGAQSLPRAFVRVTAVDSSGNPVTDAELTISRGLKDIVARATTDASGLALLTVEVKDSTDFDLAMRDGSSRVRLSALRGGRPVVLILGSYTCPPFRREMPEVRKVYADYKERAAFYFVYIEEAHAHDVWPLASNARDHVVYATAKDAAERSGVAQACTTALKIDFPTLVDGMTNGVAQAYTAWPTRMYVVDPAGRIAFKSDVGPFGFQAGALASALAAIAPEP